MRFQSRTSCFTVSGSLLPIVLLLGSCAPAASAQEEQELAGTFIRQMVELSRIAVEDMDPNHPPLRLNSDDHTHDADIGYAMALLYKTRHPLNPYYGSTRLRDDAIVRANYIARTRLRPEWPLYVISQIYALLKDELPIETRHAWELYAADYVRTEPERLLFRTAPNHEAISALAVFRAGQVFEKPEWMEKGRRLMRRVLPRQTELGYFDEGTGPSMKYNAVQLAAMLLYSDYSGDGKALEASRNLAGFMVRYSFPDGTPISVFDGRQDYCLGYFGTLAYGLDRWPEGKELNRRIYRTRRQRKVLDPRSRYYAFSNWYANFGTFLCPTNFARCVRKRRQSRCRRIRTAIGWSKTDRHSRAESSASMAGWWRYRRLKATRHIRASINWSGNPGWISGIPRPAL